MIGDIQSNIWKKRLSFIKPFSIMGMVDVQYILFYYYSPRDIYENIVMVEILDILSKPYRLCSDIHIIPKLKITDKSGLAVGFCNIKDISDDNSSEIVFGERE